eukprot:6802975-Alexandrium_andersonii.AAC.1
MPGGGGVLGRRRGVCGGGGHVGPRLLAPGGLRGAGRRPRRRPEVPWAPGGVPRPCHGLQGGAP